MEECIPTPIGRCAWWCEIRVTARYDQTWSADRIAMPIGVFLLGAPAAACILVFRLTQTVVAGALPYEHQQGSNVKPDLNKCKKPFFAILQRFSYLCGKRKNFPAVCPY
jgi:hypothetical protein